MGSGWQLWGGDGTARGGVVGGSVRHGGGSGVFCFEGSRKQSGAVEGNRGEGGKGQQGHQRQQGQPGRWSAEWPRVTLFLRLSHRGFGEEAGAKADKIKARLPSKNRQATTQTQETQTCPNNK